jgi:DNA-binding IclR family transcriptional regulator
MPAKGEKYFFISSLGKGLRVLELLAEKKELGVSDVARYLGSNRSGSHRVLATLKELGYVEKNKNKHYRLTFKIMEMGFKHVSRLEIRQIVRPHMEQLSKAFNETINLGYFDGQDIFHVDKIDSSEILRIDSPLGSKAPAYCTALGKSILAFLPQADLKAYLSSVRLKPHGPNTITSKKKLLEELTHIRQTGIAVDNEELSPDLRCVACNIFSHNRLFPYAISVSGPAFRHTDERIEQIKVFLKEQCKKISEKLGDFNSQQIKQHQS